MPRHRGPGRIPLPATALAVAWSVASFPFLLPHVVEDFSWGIADRAGLTADVGAALLGLGLAVQIVGLILSGQGKRGGLVVVAVAGAVWTLGALWEHGMALLLFGFGFRGRPLSAVWALGLLLTQVLACGFAVAALLRPWRP